MVVVGVVGVAVVLVEVDGGFGRSCDRGRGGDGSSGSSYRLLRLPKLPMPLEIA